MGTLVLPEKYTSAHASLEEGLLERIKPARPVATGTHMDSVIGLYWLAYENEMQASVFCYPSTLVLIPSRISEMDSKLSDVSHLKTRIFRDVSPDDLYQGLLKLIYPMKSFMDHRYTFCKTQVHEHSFVPGFIDYLHGAVQELSFNK